jgi:hypothetical protein
VSTALPPAALERLQKLLSLIGSDIAGERDAAIAAATRLLERHNMRWREVLIVPQAPATPRREPLQATWRKTCHRLQERPGYLRPWEKKFVADLPHFSRISTKQRYVLKEIADRVLGEFA